MKFSRSVYVKVAGAFLALAAAGATSLAHARSDVHFSIGAHVAPGVSIGVSNAPVYYPPVYVQPQPVYVHPAPIYQAPAPIFVRPAPVYYGPAPVYYGNTYYGRPHHRHGKHWKHQSQRHHRGGHWR